MSQPLLLLGASVRALCFSALRAGFAPRCIDLFADHDLASVCPARRMSGRYPQGFLEAVAEEQSVPLLYTGGLENWPGLVDQLSQRFPLWGNPGKVLRQVRDPWNVARLLQSRRLPVLRLAHRPPLSADVRWLLKPLRGAGGGGIRFADEPAVVNQPQKGVYYQEHAAGESVAALFVAAGGAARLLGVTRQLVGEAWLGAAPFRYCGSVGPLEVPSPLRENVEQVGKALCWGCGLRGLFGVDGILRDGKFWPVEVNPRYTVSVEVLEYATGLCAVAEHAAVFTGQTCSTRKTHRSFIGKAILFARQSLSFPEAESWSCSPGVRVDPEALPSFADIPAAGERIEAGRPILTFFTRGTSCDEILARLRTQAAELERLLYR